MKTGEIWLRAVELSWREFQKLYDLLGIRFDQRLGESFYNDALGPLCEQAGFGGSRRDERRSALHLFPRHSCTRGQTGHHSQKRRRVSLRHDRPGHHRIPGQEMESFRDLVCGRRSRRRFTSSRCSPRPVEWALTADLQHVAFGSILGEDRKIMRTRAGETIGLAELLEEAIGRARAIVAEKNPSLESRTAEEIALGDRPRRDQIRRTFPTSDDRLRLLLEQDCFRFRETRRLISKMPTCEFARSSASWNDEFHAPEVLTVDAAEERALAVKFLQFGEVVPLVLEDFRPNLLANYLLRSGNRLSCLL